MPFICCIAKKRNKVSRKTLIYAILAIVIVVYMFIMVPVTNSAERNDTFKQLRIEVVDPANTGFLTEADVNAVLGNLQGRMDTLRRRNLNTYEVQCRLNAFNRVENASCLQLNDGTLLVRVEPFDPVARVFDRKGSVYVNAAGKRVKAAPGYHVDVPVVTTEAVADTTMVRKLLPILRVIKQDARANALVTSLRIDRRGDIIIIPGVVGHVINFGDTTLIDNKLERLHAFYRDVMPVRGWDAFDTISVKWNGRIVATKRDKTVPQRIPLDRLDDIVDEVLDDEVMLTNID